ncbi:MAG: pyruvate, phosphate dikinase [Acidobacteria bacterium]|nr:pyruvate, phosphate dikinase [Acidobacteriota bacterium]
MPDKRWVYFFGDGKAEGDGKMKHLLGGKGAGLAEMTKIGVPVPPGFTISTEACVEYVAKGGELPEGLEKEVARNLKALEKATGKGLGDTKRPLLVSVRSGARASMPGMMDTILNLGLNDGTVEGLAAASGDERFALDSYRRFIQMYSNVVLGLDHGAMEQVLDAIREEAGVETDAEIPPDGLRKLIEKYEAIVEEQSGKPFPQDVDDQLWGAIRAVFDSWNNKRAVTYRRLNGIPDEWGTAVNVQSMVFGNMGEGSATGVAFTRDPSTGERRFYGEFLPNAQGEDVVAGIRTPRPISKERARHPGDSLEESMPAAYRELMEVQQKLEAHFGDMQDIEFTVESGRLYLLQTRTGKRTGFAAVRIACEMVDEGVIEPEEALRRIEAGSLSQLLAPIFDQKEKEKGIREDRLIARGLPAGPGAAAGRIAFSAERAQQMAGSGSDPVVLVRIETSPEDIAGMHVAAGILTTRGGLTSHAAVVARGMGKPCVVGAGEIRIDYQRVQMRVSPDRSPLEEGDWISIDGSTGEVFHGKITTRPSEILQVLVDGTMKPEESETFQRYDRVMKWADEVRRMGVRTNADTPHDARVASLFGAEGIGLCRTEHMFFQEERITPVREMILARNEEGRRKALAKLLPYQREDFAGIFRALDGKPVTIRLLDPPLHEFLPHTEAQISAMARDLGWGFIELREKVAELDEVNPMLGHRGCRLGVTNPEIYEMQVRAIYEAAVLVRREGVEVWPEVMVPLVGTTIELRNVRELIQRVAEEVCREEGVEIPVVIGTMIEVPRAALVADAIAESADFFSFGTNDLTQMTFGFSRDDVGSFMPTYLDQRILDRDPFESLDTEGVGSLVRIGTEKGRATNPKLKVGICGEHGGEPDSIRFFRSVGLDYVSCSPYRVPIARLAAAQAELMEENLKSEG